MYSGQYAASAELTMTFTSSSDMLFPCNFPNPLRRSRFSRLNEGRR
jgi:hypothetical protein